MNPGCDVILVPPAGMAGMDLELTAFQDNRLARFDAQAGERIALLGATEGEVERVSEEESFAYFSSRGRGSRIGAWASPQSSVLRDRAELEARASERKQEFAGGEVPLPPFWGGYLVKPERIEFWQGRADRLHDRLCYTRVDDTWTMARLAP